MPSGSHLGGTTARALGTGQPETSLELGWPKAHQSVVTDNFLLDGRGLVAENDKVERGLVARARHHESVRTEERAGACRVQGTVASISFTTMASKVGIRIQPAEQGNDILRAIVVNEINGAFAVEL